MAAVHGRRSVLAFFLVLFFLDCFFPDLASEAARFSLLSPANLKHVIGVGEPALRRTLGGTGGSRGGGGGGRASSGSGSRGSGASGGGRARSGSRGSGGGIGWLRGGGRAVPGNRATSSHTTHNAASYSNSSWTFLLAFALVSFSFHCCFARTSAFSIVSYMI